MPPNRYLSYISSSSDGEDILGDIESDTCCTRSTSSISTRSKKVRKDFVDACNILFPTEGHVIMMLREYMTLSFALGIDI